MREMVAGFIKQYLNFLSLFIFLLPAFLLIKKNDNGKILIIFFWNCNQRRVFILIYFQKYCSYLQHPETNLYIHLILCKTKLPFGSPHCMVLVKRYLILSNPLERGFV